MQKLVAERHYTIILIKFKDTRTGREIVCIWVEYIENMLLATDKSIPHGIELVRDFGKRKILCAFHDIDGTHSLIRKWVPVMTVCTGFASFNIWDDSLTTKELARKICEHSAEEYPEAYRFSIESAGLSALTQMEWAIRNALANGVRKLDGSTPEANAAVVAGIWQGREVFPEIAESADFRRHVGELASQLFRAYELVLREQCRDANLALARKEPGTWRVAGSMDFLHYLKANGVRNYFVTGAVIEYDEAGTAHGTMAEEVEALGYEIGPGKVMDKLVGSVWNRKLPKDELMLEICRNEHLSPENVLIVGDGRSEIAAGVEMGALCLSRLPVEATRAREIHRAIGTNLIVPDYKLADLKQVFVPVND